MLFNIIIFFILILSSSKYIDCVVFTLMGPYMAYISSPADPTPSLGWHVVLSESRCCCFGISIDGLGMKQWVSWCHPTRCHR